MLCLGALPKDVHNELIQHKRAWMKKRGIVKGKLSVNSAEQRLNGSCPLMPEEVRVCAYQILSCLVIHAWEMCFGFPPNLHFR